MSCSCANSLDQQGKANLKKTFIKKHKSIDLSHLGYLLVGAPNVGKSTFFNKITWQNSPVGNADRITVTSKLGSLRADSKIKIIDVPGIYNLNPCSYDENVTIDTIFKQNYFTCINIVSALSIKRDLILTTQLLESGIVKEVVVNMIDELTEYEINPFKLSQKLKTKVSLVSATKNIGVKSTVKSVLDDSVKSSNKFKITYSNTIENAIEKIIKLIPKQEKLSQRFIAVQYLEANVYVQQLFNEWNISEDALDILKKLKLDLRTTKKIIKEYRIKFINEIITFCKQSIKDEKRQLKTIKCLKIQKNLDKLFLNPWFGWIFFILIISAIYYITFGQYAGGFINDKWTGLLEQGQDAIKQAIANSMGQQAHSLWVQNFVGDGLLGGIFTVIGFVPYIIIMFFLINLIEQTGYLSRVSLLVDKQFEKFGISGKSLITLITGIGCNIPAVMMARNSHSLKERTIVFLISPFMACSARLLVFIWIANVIVGTQFAWLLGVAFTFFTGFVTLGVGLLFSKTMFRNNHTFFLTELPRWRTPSLFIVFKKVGLETLDFLKRVTTIIFIVNLVMFLLMYISPTLGLIDDLSILASQNIDWSKASLLQYISLPFQYLFYPIGLGQDWRFATSLLAAAPAKELAASNISLLFNGVGDVDGITAQGFINALFQSTVVTLPVASLVSYLVMFAFYTPCLSTTVVMRKEGGFKNTLIHLTAAFGLSYLMCFISYIGIGSIEKIIDGSIQNPLIAANPLAIIAWSLIGIGGISLLVSFLVKQHLDSSNKLITWKTTRTYYIMYVSFASTMLLGMFFMLCFMFIY